MHHYFIELSRVECSVKIVCATLLSDCWCVAGCLTFETIVLSPNDIIIEWVVCMLIMEQCAMMR